jgi:NitT/TauT family transport system ATP-binding protein
MEIGSGEAVSILGRSGCGKTSFIRCAAGFIRPAGGAAYYRDRQIKKPMRKTAFIFQDYNQLFPWKTIMENAASPLLLNNTEKLSKAEIMNKAEKNLELAGLSGKAAAYPHELSGGMLQRAALARALTLGADIFLMDEPFSSLDTAGRRKLQTLLREMVKNLGISILFVTHDINEAVRISDRIITVKTESGAWTDTEEFRVPHEAVNPKEKLADLEKQIFSLFTD